MKHIKEAKMCLIDGKSYLAIAKLTGCTSQTAKRRIITTLLDLVDYFDFRGKGIEFPHIKHNYPKSVFFRWQLGNFKKHPDFWIKVIKDYEDGVQAYKTPQIAHESMLLRNLTVSEFKDLLKDILP
jgi:hypothetical protein